MQDGNPFLTLKFSFERAIQVVLSTISRFGGNGGGVPRVPIPNTTVKTSSANGTWTAGSWESRTSPSRAFLILV